MKKTAEANFNSPRIVVIIPAYNEAQTIEETILSFQKSLPQASIWVVDNNSSDTTSLIADNVLSKLNSGGVIKELHQGKGNAVRRAFLSIDADYYVLVDADSTYPASRVNDLLKPVINNEADMVVGDRLSLGHYKSENKRPLHNLGNKVVVKLINYFFNANLSDVMSGYRAFNRSFIKNYPILVGGFEIETDMTLHALHKRFRLKELPVEYKDRPAGSFSKLNTIKDGTKVIFTIARILRYYKPMTFFGAISLVFGLAGLIASFPVFHEWMLTHYIRHIPLAILATGFELMAALSFGIGIILDSIVYQEKAKFERDLLNN